jgi:hypothetical protein
MEVVTIVFGLIAILFGRGGVLKGPYFWRWNVHVHQELEKCVSYKYMRTDRPHSRNHLLIGDDGVDNF